MEVGVPLSKMAKYTFPDMEVVAVKSALLDLVEDTTSLDKVGVLEA